MSDTTKPPPATAPTPGTPAAVRAARAARLAAELKANLHRRKALSRSRDKADDAASAEEAIGEASGSDDPSTPHR